MTPRTRTSSRVLAAIPLAALAVVGSITAGSQHGAAPATTASAPRHRPAVTPAPAPAPLAPVDVAPTTQDAATAWHGKVRTAADVVASTSDIPAAALAAYQRAASTIDTAAPTCHLDWTFLAAIGKVESNHGAGRLDAQGVAQPAIVGPALTGDHGTALVADTDGGVYDGDTTYDHAVGPMQILPSTWSSVGVDANGDGKRDPQNIDDAALAAAVFLCADGGDLGTPAGQHAAALRYNPAQWYADSVVAIAHDYATSTPVGSYVSAVFVPARTAVAGTIEPLTPVKHHRHHTSVPTSGPTSGPVNGPTSGPTTAPTAPTAPSSASTSSAAPAPTTGGDPSAPTAPSTTPAPVPATAAELGSMCSAAIAKAYPDATADAKQQATDTCVQKLTGDTTDEAQAALADVVDALVKTYPALVPAPATDPSATPSAAPSAAPSATTSDPATASGAATTDGGTPAP